MTKFSFSGLSLFAGVALIAAATATTTAIAGSAERKDNRSFDAGILRLYTAALPAGSGTRKVGRDLLEVRAAVGIVNACTGSTLRAVQRAGTVSAHAQCARLVN